MGIEIELQHILTVGSIVVALVALLSTRADRGKEVTRSVTQAVQHMSDKLDSMCEDVREVKADVKDLSRTIGDHRERIKVLEERQQAHDGRISALEQRCEQRVAGGIHE